MTQTALAAMMAFALSALSVLPAVAQSTAASRIWVSGKGVDAAGCGPVGSPCRSLQFAIDNLANNGEIDILDSAGYGSLNILKGVTIVNAGGATAGVQATAGVAINISTIGQPVYIEGLDINGQNQNALTGIEVNAVGSLSIVDCRVRQFRNFGIHLIPQFGFAKIVISNVNVSDNGNGISWIPASGNASVSGVIDRVVASNNGNAGIDIEYPNIPPGSGVAIPSENFLVSHSIVANNLFSGILAVGTNQTGTEVDVDDSEMMGSVEGLQGVGGVTIYVSRSIMSQNAEGIDNETVSPGGIFSYGDNLVQGNGTQTTGTPIFAAGPS
jgi:hypothetical protein